MIEIKKLLHHKKCLRNETISKKICMRTSFVMVQESPYCGYPIHVFIAINSKPKPRVSEFRNTHQRFIKGRPSRNSNKNEISRSCLSLLKIRVFRRVTERPQLFVEFLKVWETLAIILRVFKSI